MRVHFGEMTGEAESMPVSENLRPIRAPRSRLGYGLAVLAGLLLLAVIPLHELLHLLAQPKGGRSQRSVVVVMPARLQLGVYYEGCMSRRRWLWMGLAPLLCLSVLPACLLALLPVYIMGFTLNTGLQAMMVANSVDSGGDLMAALVVIRQVPPRGRICFRQGRAYWLPG